MGRDRFQDRGWGKRHTPRKVGDSRHTHTSMGLETLTLGGQERHTYLQKVEERITLIPGCEGRHLYTHICRRL